VLSTLNLSSNLAGPEPAPLIKSGSEAVSAIVVQKYVDLAANCIQGQLIGSNVTAVADGSAHWIKGEADGSARGVNTGTVAEALAMRKSGGDYVSEGVYTVRFYN
jgi:hypothetical protein